jgi:hypothetical protein
MFLLNIRTFGNYIVQKPKTRPSSDMMNRTTGLLITPEAKHKEYKKMAVIAKKNRCDLRKHP